MTSDETRPRLTIDLARPLLPSQIEAANALYTRLPNWVAAEGALLALTERFPTFELEATLLKVAAINQLYGTNLYAVTRMAYHLTEILADVEHQTPSDPLSDAALVEHLASLPPSLGQARVRRHWSFASKFAHFFIDRLRFPIYDSYANGRLKHHLGRRNMSIDVSHPYQTFVQNLLALRAATDFDFTTVELDRYLWLGGLYDAWTRNPESKINRDVAMLFESADPRNVADLQELVD